MPQKALVLGNKTRSFLTAIRSLGRAGVEVHIGWHDANNAAARSRYVAKTHDLPWYRYGSDAWKTALIDLMKREAFDLVLPCHDQGLIPLQLHRKDLEPFGRIYLLDDRAFDVLLDKFKTAELARSVGVRVPRELIVTCIADAEQAKGKFALPIILKPRATYLPQTIPTRHSVKKIDKWEDFDRYVRIMLEVGPIAVQEYIAGEGVGVDLLLKDGVPLMAFQHARVHEISDAGSSYRKGVSVSPHLLDASVAMLKPLQFTGVAMVEFKTNADTEDGVLMEINPRFWGSMPLSEVSGASFPAALFQLLVNGETEFPQTYRSGLHCRNLALDVRWLRKRVSGSAPDPALIARRVLAPFGEAGLNVLTMRERSDTFVLDDLKPAFADVRQLVDDEWTDLSVAAVERMLRVPWVRRRLETQARAAILGARTILFVCHGNICRSPFADRLGRRSFPTQTVLSAGFHRVPGRRSPDFAIQAARRWDVDLSTHRSTVLTDALVRQADVIVVFDYENYRRVLADHPGSRGRVHFIGALCPDGPLFVADPWGKDMEQFEDTYSRIAEALGRAEPQTSFSQDETAADSSA